MFFLSLVLWCVVTVAVWYSVGTDIGSALGFAVTKDAEPVIGLGHFITSEFIWFYLYFIAVTVLFAMFWFWYSPHKWQMWSILGSALILFSTYYSVQVSVAINNWRRPFFDTVQDALSGKSTSTAADLYSLIFIFAKLALVWLFVWVLTKFFVSHFVFRWRTAMNDYYVSRWPEVRHIEGASQRIQEDTMQFAKISENLGVNIVDSVMTLFAFLPVLFALSAHVAEIPILGAIPAPLFSAAIFWALFGTILLAAVGVKLPGLEFRNQRVEAAFRKELVYGEDDEDRARPPTLNELFTNVRKNYFRLYFHYLYFNIARGLYLQADNIFSYFLLIPTIAAGKITFGILQQILTAFGQVSNSFQYLVNSWPTIIDLLSIYKRLASFEAVLEGQELPDIDSDFLSKKNEIAE